MPRLPEDKPVVVFQRVGAPPHFDNEATSWVDIGLRGVSASTISGPDPLDFFPVGLSEGWNLRSVNANDIEQLELLNTKSDCKTETALVKFLAWSRIPSWRTKSNNWITYWVGTGYGKQITEFPVTDVRI
jgi:hypothetical protein